MRTFIQDHNDIFDLDDQKRPGPCQQGHKQQKAESFNDLVLDDTEL
jgi:hypothetical protein